MKFKRLNMRRSLCAPFVILLILSGVSITVSADSPRIGLIYRAEAFTKLEQKGEDGLRRYREAIETHGGLITVLSQTYDPEALESCLEQLDGVLLPGGIDVDPKYYGEEPHECLGKVDVGLDQLEFKVLDYATKRRLPVLGVCRGLQVLNVHFGGSLIQDIPSQYEGTSKVAHRNPRGSKERAAHPITIEPGSILYELLGCERIGVNSMHHQAVKALATGFVVSARSDDGIVEAIEYSGQPLILGVQFHPEGLRLTDARFDALFKRLIAEANKASTRRAAKQENE